MLEEVNEAVELVLVGAGTDVVLDVGRNVDVVVDDVVVVKLVVGVVVDVDVDTVTAVVVDEIVLGEDKSSSNKPPLAKLRCREISFKLATNSRYCCF